MTSLAESIRTGLQAIAEPERAPAMQAYMKSDMPYLGVSAVPLRQFCKSAFAGLSWSSSAAWQDDVLAIWRSARFREERYAAIALAGTGAAKAFHKADALPMYEEMIVTGAWWDYIDAIAGQQFWTLLQNDREAMTKAMLVWSTDPDIWKRRSSILCQLRAKEQTDLDLLYACIEPSLDSREFFLRKAIGWALRQHARTDPDEVLRYVTQNEARMSSLSRREALKHIKETT